MNVGVFFNSAYADKNERYFGQVRAQLCKSKFNYKTVEKFSDLDGLDILFVFGGDGTILMMASECAKRDIKIIGVNYGRVGFLAEFEPEMLEKALELVCSGNYSTRKRSMLEVEFDGKVFTALNDAVIQRCTSGLNYSNTVDLRATIDGSLVDNFSADGLIVSTPTGSTAYSLSAGGSILTPDLNAFIMTPICAHSLHSRPVVFSDNSLLEILSTDKRTPLNLIVDGKIVASVGLGGKITIRKSKFCLEFITRDDNDFFNKLFIKLSIWSK